MGRERGWVAVSVRTYHSHRSQQQQQQQSRVLQQDYTVDEAGATLNAVSRSSDAAEEQRLQQQMAAAANSNSPTTSIFIRDWKVRAGAGPCGLGFTPSRIVDLPAQLLAEPPWCCKESHLLPAWLLAAPSLPLLPPPLPDGHSNLPVDARSFPAAVLTLATRRRTRPSGSIR